MKIQTVPKQTITREQFAAYEKVRRTGCYNMLADSRRSIRHTNLSDSVYWSILEHYNYLARKFPETVEKG